jgi:succinoglycan biosynthesis protein ExoA
MNVGIRAARGLYIAIMGAHTEYASDYVRKCVNLLEAHPEVCCAGGPIVSRGKSAFGRAVAMAMSHPVGVGNAKHRFPHYEGYAEGACFPMFRRETFDTVGFYDEQLVRNQDDDFNYRLARSGGKVFISPLARCIYYVRETPARLFQQYFQYGYWRVAVLQKHRLPASLRQLIPVLFFSLMLLILVSSLWLPRWWRLAGAILPIVYVLSLVVVGVGVAAKQGVRIGLLFPIATAIMHIAYAGGFILGLVDKRRRRMVKVSSPKGGFYASRA